MNAPNLLSVTEAVRLMREGALTAGELLDACLRQIGRLNPRLNAFITVCSELGALDTRKRSHTAEHDIDAESAVQAQAEPALPLDSVPIAVKDLFETENIRTTSGSLFFKDHVPKRDAAIVARLKDAGGLIIGKTNMHEIALGLTTLNPHFGACLNPWDQSRIAGGSSGGSAVAVATGMALAALGTDTGGSIRIPASLCGVVGLKPTRGRVSLTGVVPLSWNLDHAGPLTNTVRDAAILLQVIAGYDPEDPCSADQAVEDYSERLDGGINGWRIALGTGDYVSEASAEVLEAMHQAAKVLGHSGAKVEAVDVSYLHEAALANGIMTQADGAAYHHQRLADHPDWFGEDVRRRLETGRNTTSTQYVLARRTQTEMKHRLGRFFRDYDMLLLPTTPVIAPVVQGGDSFEQARRLTRFTSPFNLTGLPAISIPAGVSSEGLPIGLQIVAGAWREAALLRAAFAYEREADWGARRPPLALA
jgi:aspartyl-tRNA(Asn)/glutamyl-tRNA(Gln) amidotransferase subunit A